MRIMDLTGHKYGRLTVLRMNSRTINTKTGKLDEISYRCLCECGKECDVLGRLLRTGRHKTCGCKSTGSAMLPVVYIPDNLPKCAYIGYSHCEYAVQKLCCFACKKIESCEERCLNNPDKCGSREKGSL